jgi:hypothetical protein
MILSFSQNLLDVVICELVYIIKETRHLVKEMAFNNLDKEIIDEERSRKLLFRQ